MMGTSQTSTTCPSISVFICKKYNNILRQEILHYGTWIFSNAGNNFLFEAKKFGNRASISSQPTGGLRGWNMEYFHFKLATTRAVLETFIFTSSISNFTIRMRHFLHGRRRNANRNVKIHTQNFGFSVS